MQPITN